MATPPIEQMARFLHYLVGLRPDEFGLVPDADGFFPIAEALKAAHEEGWTRMRQVDLETLNTRAGRPVLELRGPLVGAADRSRLVGIRPADAAPKELYAPIRRRAYDAVARHGLGPQGHTGQVVLFADRELALKAGRRRDAEPLLVTVNTRKARELTGALRQFGDTIFLADRLPPECCRLPRAPRMRPRREADPPVAPTPPVTPGSYFPDLAPPTEDKSRPLSKNWKRERRKARRWKEEGDPFG